MDAILANVTDDRQCWTLCKLKNKICNYYQLLVTLHKKVNGQEYINIAGKSF